MPLNIGSMKKVELLARLYFRCSHGHDGMAHPQCYNREKGLVAKIGHFDIETFSFGFNADAGIVMTYCIKENGGPVIKNSVTVKELLSKEPDKRLLKDLCADLRKFERITTFYGKRFDVPFVRTRSLMYGLDFPGYKELSHTDVYDIVKHKLSFKSRSLGNVCRFYGIPSKVHSFGFDVWRKAFQGDEKALADIMSHNEEDVQSLEALWNLCANQFRLTDSSI